MTGFWRGVLLSGMLIFLLAPVLAQDDDDPPAGGGGSDVLKPSTMWQISCAAWDKREYKDSAVLAEKIADLNPYEDFSLEAYWRAFTCWSDLRPDAARRAKLHDKGMDLCTKWEKKYAGTDKNKAASSMWYRTQYLEKDGQRALSINVLEDAEKRFPGSTSEWNICWSLGEWLRDGKRFSEAITYYQTFWTLNGANQWGAHAVLRIGICYQEQKNNADAITVWSQMLTNEGFNWGWGEVHWNTLEIARRLKTMGEQEQARRFLLRIIDKCNPEWDVTKQAKAELGETPKPHIWIYPHQYYHYTTDRQSITENSKIKLVKEVPVLFRPSYISKDAPFSGTLTITPKVTMTQVPDNMKVDTKDDKKVYSVALNTPDAKGNLMGDTWYRFTQEDITAGPPNRLRVTREWVKAGKTWGECTITVQSNARWHIWMWLPSPTNADNFQINKPNEVHDDGRLFRWYDWWPLEQGVVFKVKVPIEVGAGVNEYYPKLKLERGIGGGDVGYSDKHVTGKSNSFDTHELAMTLSSDAEFPSSYTFPGGFDVIMDEVKN